MNRFCWPSLILIVFSLALDFGPVVAQNVTNLTDTNSTSFSKTKNRTKIDLVSCEWNEVRPKYSIVPAIVSSFLIIDGGILSTVGFRRQRTAFSILGFTVAGLVGYAIAEYKFDYNLEIRLLITGSIALFVSILCSSVLYCGIFFTGLCSGFSIGCLVIVVVSEIHDFGSFAVPILITLGLAIAFAGVTLWWNRVFLILGTSVSGGAFIMGGADYFIEGFLFTEYVQHIIYGQKFRKLCYFSWLVFAIFPVVAISGVLVQHFKTAKLEKQPASLSHQALAMNRLSTSSHHSRA